MTAITTTVRDARRGDLPAVAAIYARAAEATPATFDLAGHPVAWWAAVLADGEYPFLVAGERDAVLGFARATRHKDRPGFSITVETSVYVAETARGRGIGTALYAALLERLEADERRRLAVAGVALPNAASERLHAAHGFTPVGTFHAVGVKFGREIDVRWYERRLAR